MLRYLFTSVKGQNAITLVRMVTFGGGNIECSIAGFEMILREDFKSRDEVEGLIIFPKHHFKPQDTVHSVMFPTTKVPLSYKWLPITLHRGSACRQFTKLSIFFHRGFPLSQ